MKRKCICTQFFESATSAPIADETWQEKIAAKHTLINGYCVKRCTGELSWRCWQRPIMSDEAKETFTSRDRIYQYNARPLPTLTKFKSQRLAVFFSPDWLWNDGVDRVLIKMHAFCPTRSQYYVVHNFDRLAVKFAYCCRSGLFSCASIESAITCQKWKYQPLWALTKE